PIEPPRKKGGTNPDFVPVPPASPWRPAATEGMADADAEPAPPVREPTLILPEEPPSAPPAAVAAAAPTDDKPRERWSQPILLSELVDRTRDSSLDLLANVKDDL